MLLGSAGAAGNGAALPLFALIFGNLVNSLGGLDSNPDLGSEVNKYAREQSGAAD
jgi:hypothetical protein